MNGWKITAKSNGGQCEHCGASLKFMWTIRHEDGRTMGVGRTCIKRVTGWTVSAQEAENALKVAAMDARWTEFAAAYPQQAAAIQAAWNATIAEQAALRAAGLDPYGAVQNPAGEYRYAARTGNWEFAASYAAAA